MIALLFASAYAGLCYTFDGMAEGPTGAGFRDGDLGEARRLCPRSELGFGGGGLLVVDTPNFYGHLVAGGTVWGSGRLSDRAEVFGAFEAVRYDSVIGALSSSVLSPGFGIVGLSGRFAEGEDWGLALNGAALLPTAFGLYRHAVPVGADLGLAGGWRVHERVRLHGQVSALGTAAVSVAPADPRFGANVDAGVEWRPGRAFAAALDLVGGFGNGQMVEAAGVAPALRFAVGRRVGLGLEATVPVFGRRPPLATVDLGMTVRLGADGSPPAPAP